MDLPPDPALTRELPPGVRVATIDLVGAWHSVMGDPAIMAKVLVGSILMLAGLFLVPLPITFPVLLGYALFTVRNAIAGEPHPLPDWQDFAALWLAGFRYFLVVLLFLSPFVLAGVLCIGLIFGGAIMSRTAEGQAMLMAGGILYYLLILGANLVGLAMRFTVFPVAMIQLAATDELSAAVSLRLLWDTFRRNPWNILLSGLIKFVTGYAMLIGCLFCILPAFPIGFLGQMLAAAALGQSHRLKLQAYGELA